jgi:ComF family protein
MRIKELFPDFLALLYPSLCFACDDVLLSGEFDFCTDCRTNLPYLSYHLPDPAQAAATSPLNRRFWGKVPVEHALAYLQFVAKGRVQHLLHRLKYDDQPEIGRILGRWFGAELAQAGYAAEFDALVPVPMHPAKQRRRGYNQATCFAEGLGESLALPIWETALVKSKETESQTRKNRLSRWENVDHGFEAAVGSQLIGQRVLLVDDVLTTGATLEVCAGVALAAGAASVSVVTIATAG